MTRRSHNREFDVSGLNKSLPVEILQISFAIQVTSSDVSNYVRCSMSVRSKPEFGPFDVRKNDVRVASMCDLLNLEMGPTTLVI